MNHQQIQWMLFCQNKHSAYTPSSIFLIISLALAQKGSCLFSLTANMCLSTGKMHCLTKGALETVNGMQQTGFQ